MTTWIVETLVATTILLVFVLLVRGYVARTLGVRTAYLLWLLPALRMVLPPLPESVGPAPIEHLPVIVDFSMIEAVEAAPVTPESGIAWGTVVLAIWLTGALCYFGWHLIAYRRFVRHALARATQLPEYDRAGIEVCASPAVDGPFATGVFVPRIVLPHDYRHRYTAEELRLALTHEWAHHRRGDLSFNYLALVLLSLHWFNPIAHRAWRAFRADQELACDAIVLNGASPDERHAYGSALVKSACRRTPAAACALNPRNQLKLRLLMMRDARERAIVGRALAVTLVGGGLALTASGGLAAETTRQMENSVRNSVVEQTAMLHAAVAPTMDDGVDLPEMPTPPAAPEAPDAPAPVAAPVPPVPPAPPAPPARADRWDRFDEHWSEAEESRQDALRDAEDARRDAEEARREAWQEAMEARREALQEAEDARREALSEARKARREALRNIPKVSVTAVKCTGKSQTSESVVQTSNGERRHIVRVCVPKADHAQIRSVTISALTDARASIAASTGMSADERVHALSSIDSQLARLKAEAR